MSVKIQEKMRNALFFLLVIVSAAAFAQKIVPLNGYPKFNILLTDNTHFKSSELKKNTSLILIYFAPDCYHCRSFIGNFMGAIKKFSQTQIVLVSHVPISELKKFSKDFSLNTYSNIKIGTEGNSFYLPSYFKIGNFPFTALYNKAGKLIATYSEAPTMDVLASKVNEKKF